MPKTERAADRTDEAADCRRGAPTPRTTPPPWTRPWATVRDAAAMFGCSVRTIRRLVVRVQIIGAIVPRPVAPMRIFAVLVVVRPWWRFWPYRGAR